MEDIIQKLKSNNSYTSSNTYIEMIQKKIDKTHYCFNENNFENGKVFIAVKKSL